MNLKRKRCETCEHLKPFELAARSVYVSGR
jgi:hypothetical protein